MKFKVNKINQDKKRINKRILLWMLTVVFIGVQIFLTIQTAVSGARLASLESEKRKAIEQNKQLSEILVSNVSLSGLNDDAEQLGFVKPQNMMYVGEEETVARLP